MFLRDPVHHTLRDEGLTNGMLHLIGYIFSGRCSVPSTVLFAKVASRRIPETCTVVYRVAQVLFYLTRIALELMSILRASYRFASTSASTFTSNEVVKSNRRNHRIRMECRSLNPQFLYNYWHSQ